MTPMSGPCGAARTAPISTVGALFQADTEVAVALLLAPGGAADRLSSAKRCPGAEQTLSGLRNRARRPLPTPDARAAEGSGRTLEPGRERAGGARAAAAAGRPRGLGPGAQRAGPRQESGADDARRGLRRPLTFLERRSASPTRAGRAGSDGPGVLGIAVISPPLDETGNSVRAQKAIADISNALGGNPLAAKPR
jgi:hypothetical protein